MRRLITFAVIEGFFENHLLLQANGFREFLILIAEAGVLLNERNNVGVKVQHPLIELKVVNFLNGLGDFYRIIEDSHSETPLTLRVPQGDEKANHSHVSRFAQFSDFGVLSGVEKSVSCVFSANRDIPTPPASICLRAKKTLRQASPALFPAG